MTIQGTINLIRFAELDYLKEEIEEIKPIAYCQPCDLLFEGYRAFEGHVKKVHDIVIGKWFK